MPTLETPNSGTGANLPTTTLGGDASTREKVKDAQTYDVEDSESEPEPDKEAPDGAVGAESSMITHLHQMFSERLDAMQSMVERLPRVAPPIRKSNPDSYAETPFTDEITLIEMPRKFSFPSIKAYDGTTDPDDHVAQYRQRMLAVALQKGLREATMCKGLGYTLTGPALQWYINLPSRSIASFGILSDKFVEQFVSSRDLEKTSDSLYEILQHQAEPLRGYIARFNQEKVAIPECNVLSRAWAHVKWEEDVASRAKAQRKQDPKTIRPDRAEQDEKPSQRPAKDSGNQNMGRYQNRPIEKAEGMAVSTWPDISHLSVSRPELVNVLRQMGQQVKWPQKMKAPDSFRNPVFWCHFHRDHGHKTDDCVALKIESKPTAPHTEEPEVEEMDDVPLTEGDQTRHLKIGGGDDANMISYATLDELRPADDTEDKLKPAEESVYELKPAEMVQSSELVRPPELVWSPDFRPSTMIVSYGPTSE
ncbi:hypothetical protein F2Q69_00022702 [Brassica cretica]|uniref:Retrotransposon gag domain-containing protein n=1 Tax=Brassica cretica TaxID=69181 RepID=A0A8S9QI95_BRACR|nr:hypothetical protein F2Q69_00022702 [Brassica cretica]